MTPLTQRKKCDKKKKNNHIFFFCNTSFTVIVMNITMFNRFQAFCYQYASIQFIFTSYFISYTYFFILNFFLQILLPLYFFYLFITLSAQKVQPALVVMPRNKCVLLLLLLYKCGI